MGIQWVDQDNKGFLFHFFCFCRREAKPQAVATKAMGKAVTMAENAATAGSVVMASQEKRQGQRLKNGRGVVVRST